MRSTSADRVELIVPCQILVQVYELRRRSCCLIDMEFCDTCCAPQQLLSSSSAQQLSQRYTTLLDKLVVCSLGSTPRSASHGAEVCKPTSQKLGEGSRAQAKHAVPCLIGLGDVPEAAGDQRGVRQV